MRTHKSLILVLFLALATTLATAQAQEEKLSNTREASFIVRITADPAIVPLNEETVTHLLDRSYASMNDLISKTLGMEVTGDLREFIDVVWLSSTLEPAGSRAIGTAGTGPMNSGTGGMGPGMMGSAGGMGGMGMMPGAGGMGGMGMMPGAGGMDRGMSGAGGMGMMGGTGGGRMMNDGKISVPLQQTVAFTLYAGVSDKAKPAAKEVLELLIMKLRASLDAAYQMQQEQLAETIEMAQARQEHAQEQLDRFAGVQSRANKQIDRALSERVDISMLSQDMAFGRAIEILKNSIDPPLPIVVLWNELIDNADISPDSPIGMDGLENIKLVSALETLLKAASGGSAELSYRMDDDVIVVYVKAPSERGQAALTGIPAEENIMDLLQQRRKLAGDIREYELRVATSEARQNAIRMQIEETRHEATRKLKEDSVAQELNRLVELSEMNLRQIEQQFQTGTISQAAMTEARKKIAQAKIELARRREELGRSAGGGQLSGLSEDLSKLTIDIVEYRAALEILQRQLAEVDQQLARARISDPRARQIQTARQILAMAEQRVIELNRQLTNLQRPIVTTIGAN